MLEEAYKRIQATIDEQLEYLDLSGLGLDHIPPEVTELTWIGALSLSRNSISDISLLSKMPNLHKLALSDNQIEEISVLDTLPKLRFIFLGGNKVKDISVLRSQARLKKLVLHDNDLQALPDLSHFPLMVYLDISNNPLVSPTGEQIKQMLPLMKVYKP
jgi:Leucine-rich repeat (LRR) protein